MGKRFGWSNGESVDLPNAATHLRNFLRPCALLLLDERPACGYELHDRLEPFSGGAWDHGAVYRVLNTMEEEGLVFSTWERSTSGPQRRRYRLTEQGQTALGGCAGQLEAVRNLLSSFISRYEDDQEAHEATLVGSQPEDDPKRCERVELRGGRDGRAADPRPQTPELT